MGKIMIYDSHQALDVLLVSRQEGPEAKFLFLTPTVFPSQFGSDVTGRKAVEQNRHFIYQFDGISGDTWRKCIAHQRDQRHEGEIDFHYGRTSQISEEQGMP